jgi:hypothetical protein
MAAGHHRPGHLARRQPAPAPTGQGLPGPWPPLAARTGRLAISEACPTTHQLVVVNRPGGKVLSRPLRVDQSFTGLAFDPSGRHLLYTTWPGGHGLAARVRSLQVLRMLELLGGETSLGPEVRRIVADRLRAMLR